MATLHIVNRPTALASCLAVAAEEDSVLLIEEGVLAATVEQPRTLIALAEDLTLHGISLVSEQIQKTDYAGFVDLVATHQPVVSWR